eukprot:12554665-Prorocentrum_lima.AAC.1
MTSSLVGSEMCIRDRSCKLGKMIEAFSNAGARSRFTSFAYDKMEEKYNACLLYTSDAADDM